MIEFAFAGIPSGQDVRLRRRVGAGGTAAVPVPLETLAQAARDARVVGDPTLGIVDLAYDSRAVVPGMLFFCVPGRRADGQDFAGTAIEAGAVALVVERTLPIEVPRIVVPSVRTAMGPMAAAFFDHPSRAMTLVGVTGTNGKTTTAFMVESAFRALGMATGLAGTIETHVGDEVLPVTRTTPESVDLQRLLGHMRDVGVEGVAMEVSSHGLDFGRVEGTSFACAVFTNLTQDHLDYHETMEEYFEAKARLFEPDMAARAVVNVDDEYGAQLAARAAIPLTTFSMYGDADARAHSVALERTGSVLVADVAGKRVEVRVPLPARYNAQNALGVLAVGHALGLSLDGVARGIEALRGVPGRMEAIEAGQDFTVLVDYAHTPDSIKGVLGAARELTLPGARLTIVFGCGGDRDREKRPMMGAVAAVLADRTIVTSDNPRSEDPLEIIEAIELGVRVAGGTSERIPDRGEAIKKALCDANPGDVIVIAGKGHETGQEFADRTVLFDDRAVARAILEEL